MEKDPTTYRRHRPGPGALPSGITPGYLKVASEGAELQRSRSVGGLHQKGDPPVCIRKLLRKDLDSEDQGKDPRSDTDDTTCQVSPEEDIKKKNQDEPEKLDQKCEKTEPGKSTSETSATEQDDARKGRSTSVAEEQEPESMKLNNLLEKQKPSVFVEIDLGDHTEEEGTHTVVTCAVREEKRLPMDTGDLSEDETRTSWVCCIPYSTKRKVKEATNALEKGKALHSHQLLRASQPLVEGQSDSSQRRAKTGTLLQPKANNSCKDDLWFQAPPGVDKCSNKLWSFITHPALWKDLPAPLSANDGEDFILQGSLANIQGPLFLKEP
ncbi:hypothetical protein HispidOSU_027046 [Sigmodon hispidus]